MAHNTALKESGKQIWLLLDRLDVAFPETHELERNALRALFRAYRDLAEHDAIKLKIFLRSDIWSRIKPRFAIESRHPTHDQQSDFCERFEHRMRKESLATSMRRRTCSIAYSRRRSTKALENHRRLIG
jgi:hypothetical protein